jgi:Glycosyltransferase like family
MIAFGLAIADDVKYERWALPGVTRIAESDSLVLPRRTERSIQEAYNSILEQAAELPDLEAVVLLHEDTEIADPTFLATVRQGFADPTVGVLGPIGASDVRTMAWWEGNTFGRVGAPNFGGDPLMLAAVPNGWHDVDALDGLLLVVSPWAAREVRFDERFAPYFHGYDVDYCFQVRSRRRRCLVAPMNVVHHTIWRPEHGRSWIDASIVWHRKWGIDETPRPAGLAWA